MHCYIVCPLVPLAREFFFFFTSSTQISNQCIYLAKKLIRIFTAYSKSLLHSKILILPPQQSYQTEPVQMSVFQWQPSHCLEWEPQHSSTVGIHSAALMHTGPAGQREHSDKLQWTICLLSQTCTSSSKCLVFYATWTFYKTSSKHNYYFRNSTLNTGGMRREVGQVPQREIVKCKTFWPDSIKWKVISILQKGFLQYSFKTSILANSLSVWQVWLVSENCLGQNWLAQNACLTYVHKHFKSSIIFIYLY